MGKNNNKDVRNSVVELDGNQFKRVKNGLDEAQIVPFINNLISQRDELIQREEHLTSLTKLAENTITEADKLSEEIKAQAMEQAETEATTIISEAEENSKKMVEEKRTEVINSANEEAAAIKAEAEREAELLLENQRNVVQPELSSFVHKLSSQLISELESLKSQTESLESELEQKLSQFTEEHYNLNTQAPEVPDTSQAPVQDMEQPSADKSEEKVVVIADGEDTNDSEQEAEWELEILAPMDIMKVMGVVTYLDNLPEVERTEIIPRNDKPSIVVFLNEPIQLPEIMRTIPEVSKVEEDTSDTADTDSKPKKVKIALSGKPVPQEAT